MKATLCLLLILCAHALPASAGDVVRVKAAVTQTDKEGIKTVTPVPPFDAIPGLKTSVPLGDLQLDFVATINKDKTILLETTLSSQSGADKLVSPRIVVRDGQAAAIETGSLKIELSATIR